MLALLAASASLAMAAPAAGPASCVHSAPAASAADPATLDDLVLCQRQSLDAAAAAYAQAHAGKLPSDAQMTRWQARQGAEAKLFFKRHPDQLPPELPAEGTGVTVEPQDGSQPSAEAETPSADAAPGGHTKDWQDEENLKKQLLGESAQGNKVLSPDAAKQINAYLGQKQGGPSADMSTLMQSLQKDGKPSDESIKALRKAAADPPAAP